MALARALPSSFAQAVSQQQDAVDMSLALQQHASYVQALRTLVPVLELPALPDFPDSVFVEDTVVVVEQQAVVMNPGHVSRRGEVESVQQALQQLGVEIIADLRLQTPPTAAAPTEIPYCDGGDVLYTGRHLFIGLSKRTNRAGALLLQQAFSGIQSVILPPLVTAMTNNKNHPLLLLHLKSAVTLFSPDTLVLPTGPVGDALLQSLSVQYANFYSVVRVPDVLACNVVAINRVVLVQETSCFESKRVLEMAALERNVELIYINTSELAKKDAALTCCSVLLNC